MKLCGGGSLKVVENFAALLKVKTLVTIITTIIFAVMLIRGMEIPEYFKYVYTMIICFYFGTQ